MTPTWVSKEALRLLHRTSLRLYGGSDGLRDEGLLESALARPQNLFLYDPNQDLEAIAATYAYGLVKNHAFVDGNKRVAFLTCVLFLELNGKFLKADQVDAFAAVTALAASTITEGQFASWLRANI